MMSLIGRPLTFQIQLNCFFLIFISSLEVFLVFSAINDRLELAWPQDCIIIIMHAEIDHVRVVCDIDLYGSCGRWGAVNLVKYYVAAISVVAGESESAGWGC